MVQLSKNWLTENLIDFEYKQYILLAYLESVNTQFNKHQLYPCLSELIEHHKELQKFQHELRGLYNAFPETLCSIDLKQVKLSYEKVVKNDAIVNELEEIIQFSIPQIEKKLQLGKEIYQYVEEHVKMESIGLMPLYTEEGYLLLRMPQQAQTRVFEYGLKLFNGANDTYRSLNTRYITTFSTSNFETPETLKHNLIKRYPAMPNPATFFMNTSIDIPFDEAYFPVAKRMLMKALSNDLPRTMG
jgi:hypothetical protein